MFCIRFNEVTNIFSIQGYKESSKLHLKLGAWLTDCDIDIFAKDKNQKVAMDNLKPCTELYSFLKHFQPLKNSKSKKGKKDQEKKSGL